MLMCLDEVEQYRRVYAMLEKIMEKGKLSPSNQLLLQIRKHKMIKSTIKIILLIKKKKK